MQTLTLAVLSDQCAAVLQEQGQQQHQSTRALQEAAPQEQHAETKGNNHTREHQYHQHHKEEGQHHNQQQQQHHQHQHHPKHMGISRQADRFPPDAGVLSPDPSAHPAVKNPFKGQPRLPLHNHRLPDAHGRRRKRRRYGHGGKGKGYGPRNATDAAVQRRWEVRGC